jgi:hypothetical protein
MSAFERLLVPGCTELPECRCGEEMQVTGIDELRDSSDAAIASTLVPLASMRCGLLSGLQNKRLKGPQPFSRLLWRLSRNALAFK